MASLCVIDPDAQCAPLRNIIDNFEIINNIETIENYEIIGNIKTIETGEIIENVKTIVGDGLDRPAVKNPAKKPDPSKKNI
jgi:hypothetical protein